MKLLTNKIFKTDKGDWYDAMNAFSAKYKSFLHYRFTDTTSSAGDWSGFIVQQTGKDTVCAIGFTQENNYPAGGFTVYTCDGPFYHGTLDEPGLFDNIESCWLQCAYDKHTGELI